MTLALEVTLTTFSGEQTTRFLLLTQYTTIGRLAENDIQIPKYCVSRKHATIELHHGHIFIHDHSTCGTWVNGTRLMSGGRGVALRYDDVRARLPCIPTTALHPHDCMATLSRHTCPLSTHRTLSSASHPTLSVRRTTLFVHAPAFA